MPVKLKTPKIKLSHTGHLFITGEIIVVMIDAVEKFHVIAWVIVGGCTILVHLPAVSEYLEKLAKKLEEEEDNVQEK